jgi:glycosyltransferase involved in cell wall biosynthesis
MDISIIIPHRNIPELLKRCIDSIPITNNIEVIIVDDNSDDEIVDFTHFPGKERPNTQVIFTKKGKGAGYARI